MSDYLYFSNNLKDMKDHIYMNLKLPLSFHSILLFVVEAIHFRTNYRVQVWSLFRD